MACFLPGGPEGTRTLDLSDANRTLSQTELQAHIKCLIIINPASGFVNIK